MSRWWRAYDEAVDDPKLQRLGPKLGWAWFNLMCISSKNDGFLPPIGDVAFKLRMTEQQAAATIAALVAACLFDRHENGRFTPHNWNARQFKSDVSTERVKRFRKQQRNVSSDVSETPPETETETETETEQIQKDSEPIGSGAEAPIDHRKRLFDEGLPKLARLTGKGPDACRSFVGKCLKAASDDAVTVLGLIEEAERNQAVDPSAWIVARLKPVEIGNEKTRDNPRSGSLIGAIDRRLAALEIEGNADLALSADNLLCIPNRSIQRS